MEVSNVILESKRFEAYNKQTNKCIAYGVLKLREQAGLSQNELAQLAGVGRSLILKIEKGNHTPPLLSLEKIAFVFDLGVFQFLNRCKEIYVAC